MPQPGDQFEGFTLVREAGRGAMGTVWEARQDSLDRIVALKLLSGAFAADPIWVARFKAEAGQASRLSHPGILPVYAVGETEGINWFAMELVRGEDLGARLARTGSMPIEEATRWIRDAALALDHAHENGIVHRDVKPANLMLRDDGRVAITDFGLAKTMGSGALTTTGLLVGTPYYMSPEVASGNVEAIGPWTDVYGLAVTLYELLTGRPPFLSQNTVALIRQITEEEPKRPSSFRPEIPRDLETIVLSAMAKEPQRRYRTAKAFADDLDRFLAGETIAVRRPGLGERLVRKARRHRFGVGLTIATLLGTVGVVAFFLVQMSRQEEEHRREIDEVMREVDRHAAEDDYEDAEKRLTAAEPLARSEQERRSLQDRRERISLGRFLMGPQALKAAPKLFEDWQGQPPGTVHLAIDPADATVEVAGLLGPDGEARTGEWSVPAGLYRVRARAPGRVDAIATLVVPPEARARVELRLLAAEPGRQGFVHYAGVWVPETWRDRAASRSSLAPARTVRPYLLAAKPVSRREYARFVDGRPSSERNRWQPRSGASGDEDRPVTGVTFEQAQAFAGYAGARLPTESEMRNAALPALSVARGEEGDPPEPGGRRPLRPAEDWGEIAEAVARAEGVAGVGLPSAWIRAPDGKGLPWPWRPVGMTGRPRIDGRPVQSYEAGATIRLAKDAP